ncbi:Hypothetical protein D9617_14g077450 [Elsinoe fawcettii]|nr:Hypothetical protein D9617_14g077450 [Elsinoe fawcettii]
MSEHDANRPFYCHQCDKHFSTVKARNKHESEEHGYILPGEGDPSDDDISTATPPSLLWDNTDESDWTSAFGTPATTSSSTPATIPSPPPESKASARANAKREVLSRPRPMVAPSRGLLPHRQDTPERDALAATTRTFVEFYQMKLLPRDLSQYMASLNEAFAHVREDTLVRTIPALLDRLSRLHGRWLVNHDRLLSITDRALTTDIKHTLLDILNEVFGLARTLKYDVNDDLDESDDLEHYERLLQPIYQVHVVFYDMIEHNAQQAAATGPSSSRESDAASGAESDDLNGDHGNNGESSHPVVVDDIPAGPEVQVQQLQASMPAPAPQQPQAFMPAPLLQQAHAFIPAPLPQQLMHNAQGAAITQQMTLFGEARFAGPRVRPNPPVVAIDQAEPLTAEMINDLLEVLPTRHFNAFANQRMMMNNLFVFDGQVLNVPYTDQPFACDACATGHSNLNDFMVHMHHFHFVGPSLECGCDCCLAVSSGDFMRAATTLETLHRTWVALEPLVDDMMVAGVDCMPTVLFVMPNGFVPRPDRRMHEVQQDMALAGLWGTNNLAYGVDPPATL